MSTTASGTLSAAFGWNTDAGSSTSVAFGVKTKCVNDTTVPGEQCTNGKCWRTGSCGGCVAMGSETTTVGDWSTSMGEKTLAHGYASASLGFGSEAYSLGEVALGMWTEQPDLTDEQRKHKAVIATVDENDTVLRVGIGCNTEWQSHSGGTGCKKSRRLDALRVYKSGAL